MTTKKEPEPTAEKELRSRRGNTRKSNSEEVVIPGTITVKHLGEIVPLMPRLTPAPGVEARIRMCSHCGVS